MARGALVAAVVAAVCAVAPAGATASCGWSGYSYAGLASGEVAGGIAATVTSLSPPGVVHGHVAAWVGVGGYGAGPNGVDEWVQAGIVTRPGRASRLYVEWRTPRHGRRYRDLGPAGGHGRPHRLVVAEIPGRPSVWRAIVDGRVVLATLRLPGSHDRFRPIATAESWDGGRRTCNRFAFRFESLALAGEAWAWRPLGRSYRLQDPGYRVVRERRAFVARNASTAATSG